MASEPIHMISPISLYVYVYPSYCSYAKAR
jgi:hypothetical protein